MHIDTNSKEAMELSIANIFSSSISYINEKFDEMVSNFGHDYQLLNKEIYRFIETNCKELPDKILFFHLTRRLNGANEDTVGHNLCELLLTENVFSELFAKFNIKFERSHNHIEVVYNGKRVNWDNCINGNSSYMKSRLGYFKGREDFCFNGFAFKDMLYKNNYARSLYWAPEFVSNISESLGCHKLSQYYSENSTYYCYEYLVNIESVLFDGKDKLTYKEKQKYIVKCALERLEEYRNTNIRYMYDHDNPILRLEDTAKMQSDDFLSKEVITTEMLL